MGHSVGRQHPYLVCRRGGANELAAHLPLRWLQNLHGDPVMGHSVGRQHPYLVCRRGGANELAAHTAHRRLGGGGKDAGTVPRCGDGPL